MDWCKMSKGLKLDLFNSRPALLPNRGPRVFDSLEGEFIQKPHGSPKDVFKAAFKSRMPRTDYLRKSETIPDRFDLAVVDNAGNFLNLEQDLNSSRTIVMKPDKAVEKMPFSDILASPDLNAPALDIIRDKIYHVKGMTVKERLEKGLPGAHWAVGRKHEEHWNRIGPGDYEIYDQYFTKHGYMLPRHGKFNEQPSGREHPEDFDPEFLPLKARLRHHRRESVHNSKLQSTTGNKFHTDCFDRISPSKADDNPPGARSIKFSQLDRFDNIWYRQEKYVKTSGMLLSHDFDESFDKRIPFSFETHDFTSQAHAKSSGGTAADGEERNGVGNLSGGNRPSSRGAAAGAVLATPSSPPLKSSGLKLKETQDGDVDVDAGRLFTMKYFAEKSPVKYSAAFRSNAKVGMEIPVPTSGQHGGPGAYPGAYSLAAVTVKEPHKPSRPFQQDRKFYLREAMPPLDAKYPPFAELHQSGPLFDVAGSAGKNEWMAHKVKTKMSQIYPRMAKKKFPEKPKPKPIRKKIK